MSSYKIHDFESHTTNGVTINNALNVTGVSQLETLNVSSNLDVVGTLNTTGTLNINPIKELLFSDNYVSLSSLKTKLDKTQFAHSGSVGLFDTNDNSLLTLTYGSNTGYIYNLGNSAIQFLSDTIRFEQSVDFDENVTLSMNNNNIYSVNQIGVDEINFSNVDGKLIFTEGSSSTSLLTLTDTGNVGIGITNPSTRLEVDGATTLNGDLTINTQKKIILSDGNSYGNDRYIYTKWEDSVNTHQIGLEYDYYTGSGGETSSHSRINFVSNAINDEDITGAGKLTTMSVLSNGNVGIGIKGPSEKLEVDGNTVIKGQLYVGTDTTADESTIILKGTNGDGNDNECVIENRIYSSSENSELILFKGNDTIGASGPDRIRLRAAQISFDTYPSASQDRTAENIRMTIDQNGNVGINTTTPGQKLEVNGKIKGDNFLFLDTSIYSQKTKKFSFSNTTQININLSSFLPSYYTSQNIRHFKVRFHTASGDFGSASCITNETLIFVSDFAGGKQRQQVIHNNGPATVVMTTTTNLRITTNTTANNYEVFIEYWG